MADEKKYLYVWDGVNLAAGPTGRLLKIDPAANKVVGAADSGVKVAKKLVASPDGKYIYIYGEDRQVVFFDVNARKVEAVVSLAAEMNFTGSGMCVTPDGKQLWVGGGTQFNERICVIDTARKKVVNTIKSEGNISVLMSPDGKSAYAVSFDSNSVAGIAILDAQEGKVIDRIPLNSVQGVQGTIYTDDLVLSPDGNFAYAAVRVSKKNLWAVDLQARIVSDTLDSGETSGGSGVGAPAITPDSKLAFIPLSNDCIAVVDLIAKKVIEQVRHVRVGRILISPDGKLAYAQGYDLNDPGTASAMQSAQSVPRVVLIIDTSTRDIVGKIQGMASPLFMVFA